MDKELLIKDLCGRLPYSLKVLFLRDFNRICYKLSLIDVQDNEVYITSFEPYINKYVEIESIKPYLFPLSSMSNEQIEELKELCSMYDPYHDYDSYENWGIEIFNKHIHSDKYNFRFNMKVIEWLNKNHFDYNHLIEKDMAIDATGLNIY